MDAWVTNEGECRSVADLSPEIDIHAEAPSGPLLLPGRKFPLNFDCGEFTIFGRPVLIGEKNNTGLGTGLTIWDGSTVLAKYLEHQAIALELSRQTVLELGAGTGVVGLAASAAGARFVYLSDLHYTLHNTEENIRRNAGVLRGPVEAFELDWFKPRLPPPCARQDGNEGSVSLVLGADIVWISELIPPLVKTLAYLCRAIVPSPTVLIAHQTRSRAGDALFFSSLRETGFVIEAVPREEHHPRFRDNDIAIIRLRMRVDEGRDHHAVQVGR